MHYKPLLCFHGNAEEFHIVDSNTYFINAETTQYCNSMATMALRKRHNVLYVYIAYLVPYLTLVNFCN